MQLGFIDFSEKHANIGTLFWATVTEASTMRSWVAFFARWTMIGQTSHKLDLLKYIYSTPLNSGTECIKVLRQAIYPFVSQHLVGPHSYILKASTTPQTLAKVYLEESSLLGWVYLLTLHSLLALIISF